MLASYASPRDAAWLAFREPTCLNVALKTIGHDIDAELLFANIVKVTHCSFVNSLNDYFPIINARIGIVPLDSIGLPFSSTFQLPVVASVAILVTAAAYASLPP